ncbi:MAG: tetratricopeptide repeat protein [Acidimicrobiales bacterium]
MTHLPFLRMAVPEVRFGGGSLFALPFERFDRLTMGAFSDGRDRYERTGPVFLVEGNERGDGDTASEASALNETTRAQAALNLAVPGLGVPGPALSLTLFAHGDTPTGSTQGDADLELLFLHDAAGPPLDRVDLARAERLLAVVDRAGGEQLAALLALGGAATPSLTPSEQLTLCTVTLEALLLPEITSGLRRAFCRRLAHLTALDDGEREQIEALASALYTARSETVHGGSQAAGAMGGGVAQVLLARAVIALDGSGAAEDLQARRDALEEGPVLPSPELAELLPPLTFGHRPAVRMSQPTTRLPPSSWSPDLLPVAEDEMVVVAPMPGLTAEEVPAELAGAGFPLTLLEPAQVLALEDRDTSRDFVAQLLVTTPAVASVALAAEHAGGPSPGNASIVEVRERLRPWQDAAVSTLRLAGLDRFQDPELLGDFALVHGSFRYRRPTVYRQTVLLRARGEPQSLTPAHVADLARLWPLVLAATAGRPSPVVDHVLALFRRAHDAVTLSPAVRLQFLFAALEAMLGRSPRPPAPHPVAVLAGVAPVADPVPFDWYAEHGRGVRNAVAHGYWEAQDDGPTGAMAVPLLTALVAQVIPPFLMAWARFGDDRGPRAAFLDTLAGAGAGAGLDWRAEAATLPAVEAQLAGARLVRYARVGAERLVEEGRAALETGDLEGARRCFLRAADAGLVLALNDLGILERAAGNLDEARRWYAMAIDAGDARAVYNLGILEQTAGHGDEARRLYEQAAAEGEPKAMNNLGLLEEQEGNLDAARRWYERAAEGGSLRAFDNLGTLAHQAGELNEAAAWWAQGAAGGDLRSARCLGQLYLEAGDLEEAETWFEEAADAGDGPSMFYMGILANDAGNTVEADLWWGDAAAHGVLGAHQQLGLRAYQAGDPARARYHWTAGADGGDLQSAFLLGVLDDQEGRGTAWLERAAAAGHAAAVEALAAREAAP